MQGASTGASPGTTRVGKSDDPPREKSRSAFGALAIAVAGAAITGVVVGAVLAPDRTGAQASRAGESEPTLSKVATADLANAMVTLDPATSQQTVADARACKTPIAWVTVWRQPGTAGGSVRIRSGGYLSPAFVASDAPQRVAIPYPAPYETGRGVLWVIGEAKGLEIYLYPGWIMPTLDGTAPINVIWTPTDPC